MDIRAFELTDRDEVIGLWQRCGLLRSWNDPEKDIERKLQVQPELFLVGTSGAAGLVASAMAGYDGHRGSVYYLAIDPAHQARGAGRRMMAEIETRLVALGCPKLNVMVRSSNLAVRGFYEALGYEVNDVGVFGKRLIADE
jgi:ribosomal protein S18 acetylase RimI-like enzyme